MGVFAACNDDFAIVPRGAGSKFSDLIAKTLNVEVSEATIAGTTLIGSLVCLNSKGMILTDDVSTRELETLKNSLAGRLNVAEVGHRLNAFGNTVLANDYGALVHEDYEDEALAVIERVLEVKVRRARVAGSGIVGANGITTNRGTLLHPKCTPEEREEAKAVLGVAVSVSTANHGCPHLRASVLVNAHGAVLGKDTTTVEIDRIQDTML